VSIKPFKNNAKLSNNIHFKNVYITPLSDYTRLEKYLSIRLAGPPALEEWAYSPLQKTEGSYGTTSARQAP
jgi:hypothetical protein